MRILHVISALAAGGAEVLVRDLSVELAARGHEVGIAFVSRARDQGNDAAFEDDFKQRLAASRVELFEVGYSARRNVVLGTLRLRKIVKRFNPDILHVHLATALAFRILAFVTVPTIYTHHSVRFRFHPWLFRLFDKVTHSYIAISDINLEILSGMTGRPVAKIYNGVSAARFHPRKHRAHQTHFDVLSVGSLVEAKDYDTLLEAAVIIHSQLGASGRRVRFKIAGDGARLGEMRQKAEAMGLSGVVEFLGARVDVPALMSESDLMLMTSLYEGLPISLIEALHAGLPIVATDVGGCREIVRPEFNGALARARNPKDIASKVFEILSSGEAMTHFSANALRMAKQFSVETCAERHVDLYREVVQAYKSIADVA